MKSTSLAAVEPTPADGPKYTIKAVYVLRPDGRDQLITSRGAVPCLPIKREAVRDIAVSSGLVRVVLLDGRQLTIPLSLCILESVTEGA